MTAVLLVRHADALDREQWRHADHLRPLTERGYQQARGLVDLLGGYRVARVFSSPFLRCLETVQPLAASLGLAVEEAPQLAEGRGAAGTALVDGAGDQSLVLCTHGDVLPQLLCAMVPDLPSDFPCAKGSTWVLLGDGENGFRAHYLQPPA